MKRNFVILLAVLLFIAGPVAKINNLPYSEYYLVLSGVGLILLTILMFKKDSE